MNTPSIPEDQTEDQANRPRSKTPYISGNPARMRDKALTVMGITLHDHLIIADTNCVSF